MTIFARRPRDGPLHHLDEAADTMLLVHDIVAGARWSGPIGAQPQMLPVAMSWPICHRKCLPRIW